MRKLENHWIQKADFSATDYGAADQDAVLALFREHPWGDELQELEEREADGEEVCPPGLGLNAADRDILHICAIGADEWMVHHQSSDPSKQDEVETHEGVTAGQVEHMIGQFFRSETLRPA